MKNKITLTCDEATAICDKNQYKEASLWEKIRLNIHALTCKFCSLYSKHNSIMTKCYSKYGDLDQNDKRRLCETEKKEMESHMKREITSY